MTEFVNRALFGVAAAPGTGNIAVGAAVAGPYRTLGAAQDGMTFDVAITDGNAWEVRTGCVYTHGTTTLTRGTLEDSSTGAAISLSASAQVMVTSVSSRESYVERLMRGTQPGGRLTLTSGVPVTTSDVTGATTIYYTPYLHDTMVLWDGVRWRPVIFAEVSHALGTMTANANYDVFGYLNAGALALEKLAWTNDTTRATAVTIQDGRYCKSGDKTRLYLGTIRSTSTTATEDSAGGVTSQVGGKRFVWNMYNRSPRPMQVVDTTATWTYNGADWRQANAATGNKVECVVGISTDVSASLSVTVNISGASPAHLGIGLDSTTASTGISQAHNSGPSIAFDGVLNASLNTLLPAGYHYLAWLEAGYSGASLTWTGQISSGGTAGRRSGMTARVSA